MAIAQPAFVSLEQNQDATWTVALSPTEDVTGWTVTTTVRPYNGAAAIITKTIGSGITVTDTGNGVFVTTFSAADLAMTTYGPGAYVIQMHRDNAGFTYPITDPSCLLIRPADSSTYPTITNLGEYAAHALLGVTLTDSLAQQYIQLLFAAEDWVKRYCNRDFFYRATQTEYYDGWGTDTILLRRTPVTPSSVAVSLDTSGNYGQTSGSFASTTALTLGENYAVPIDSYTNDGLSYSGKVLRLGTVWPYNVERPVGFITYGRKTRCPGCIKATYTGGYALMPHSLKRAVWDLTTVLSEVSMSGRLMGSESGEGYSYSQGGPVDDADVPWSIKAGLAPFKRIPLG